MHALGPEALGKLWERVKALIPTKVSAFTNDAGYLTEIDKAEIIDAVLAAIPNANGVSF